jgi:hypothetical protein
MILVSDRGSTVELFERFMAAENEFFAYFGYHPSRSRYPERHLILDFRKHHWLLVGEKVPMAVYYSAQRLTGLRLEIGRGIFAETILDWLGSTRQLGSKGGIWRGREYTLVATELPNDGLRRCLLFTNMNECSNRILARQALAQILA